MISTKRRTIVESMQRTNRDYSDFIPKALTEYIKKKYKCSTYLAKQCCQDLIPNQMTYKVEYCPELSEEAEKIIRDAITPSMISPDGDTELFHLESLMLELANKLPEADEKTLNVLLTLAIDYIEI